MASVNTEEGFRIVQDTPLVYVKIEPEEFDGNGSHVSPNYLIQSKQDPLRNDVLSKVEIADIPSNISEQYSSFNDIQRAKSDTKADLEQHELYDNELFNEHEAIQSILPDDQDLLPKDTVENAEECNNVVFQETDNLTKDREAPSHKCSQCPKTFHIKKKLTQHEKIHSSDKPYACELCQRPFKIKQYLKYHMKRCTGEPFIVVNHEKKYECKICHKKFRQRQTLYAHGFIHSGKKPHKCDFCQRGFAFLADMRRHRERHDQEFQDANFQNKNIQNDVPNDFQNEIKPELAFSNDIDFDINHLKYEDGNDDGYTINPGLDQDNISMASNFEGNQGSICQKNLHLEESETYQNSFIAIKMEPDDQTEIIEPATEVMEPITEVMQPTHSMMSWNLSSKKSSTETEYGVWKLFSCSFTKQSKKNPKFLG